MNSGQIDGYVGMVKRNGALVFVRLCHKETFFDKKKSQWVKSEDWFTIAFFGKKADAVEREVKLNDRLIVEFGLTTFPKTGVEYRVRLQGTSFHILMPHDMHSSPGGEEPVNSDFP